MNLLRTRDFRLLSLGACLCCLGLGLVAPLNQRVAASTVALSSTVNAPTPAAGGTGLEISARPLHASWWWYINRAMGDRSRMIQVAIVMVALGIFILYQKRV
jgi:hypothetical protein